ncbi:MAG: AraC family transcriptional regulator, partial [Clostridia bacterium]|nr:AraC family transcriptional regulator [Clostridia bacterium]
GMNPAQYKMHSKINKAKLLLRSTTEIPIEEIADGLGVYDNAYFHKVFAKTTGMTPKQYRDKHIKK